MSRKATVPNELKRGPFTLHEAALAGVTPSALRGNEWLRLGKGIYRWEHAGEDPWLLFAAWRRVMGEGIAFGGYTAAWMHGLDCAPTVPVEINVPVSSPARSCSGLVVRHCDLIATDLVERRGLHATSPMRTLRDICLVKAPVEALVMLDAALHRRLVNTTTLSRYAAEAGALPGAAKLRRLVSLAARAESPMETRTRWLLFSAGLQMPEVQVDLRDSTGRLLGRADMFYREANLVIEFDGGNHRDRLVTDNRRQNELMNAGFTVLRFTASDLFTRPEAVVSQVRGALMARPRSARFAQIPPNQAA